ncbi:MAG: SulP family inorganic anion transporter, partial [Myxococcota bacterium]
MAGFKQQLYARIPAARWLSTYTWAQARGDTTAGATVGVMLIPQAMAYALLGGVPAVYGLYASLVPLLIYPILGTAPRLAVGIVALDMLAVGAGLAALGPSSPEQAASWAMTVALMVGVIHLGLAVLRLDVVFRLMSRPVITGFMVAAPLLIGLSQVSTLLRVDIERSDHVLVNTWRAVQQAHVAHAEDVALGVCAMVLLVALRVAWKGFPRALLVTIVSGVLVWWVRPDVALVGALDGQLPGWMLPDLSLGLLRDLLPTATTVALLQIISVASLGKSLGSGDEGPPLEPTHELRALG